MSALIKLAVIGQKGGSGKTPIALNMAVLAAANGWKPVVLDLDHDQASASNWGDRRGDREPLVSVVPCLPARLKQTLAAIPEQGFDLAILDTPGRQDRLSVEAAEGAAVVLVPCRPILADTDTLPTVKRMVEVAGNPTTLAVITVAPTQGTRHVDAADLIRAAGFEVAPVVLFRREVYGDSYNIGQSPTELEPRGKAALELIGLYEYISRFLQANRT
jgi:chromosome partitioning protein